MARIYLLSLKENCEQRTWGAISRRDLEPPFKSFRLGHARPEESCMRKFLVFSLFSFIGSLLLSELALCLTPCISAQTPDQSSIEGTVVSTSRETLVVRTDDDNFYLFVFDRYTTRPGIIATGSRVRVLSRLGEQEGTGLATNIAELQAGAATTTPSPGTQAKPLPPAVRDLEQDIKSEARRWHLGVRAGRRSIPSGFCSECIRN